VFRILKQPPETQRRNKPMQSDSSPSEIPVRAAEENKRPKCRRDFVRIPGGIDRGLTKDLVKAHPQFRSPEIYLWKESRNGLR
jgi:hypothetical protein